MLLLYRQNGNAPLGFGEFAFEAVGFFMESRNMDGCKVEESMGADKLRMEEMTSGSSASGFSLNPTWGRC